jgi:transcription elongation factor GreA
VSSQREPMTPKGYEVLKERLRVLKEVEMPRISREIGAARELGDLSENAEYHAAKDKQGIIAAQIRQMEDKMARSEVIDPGKLTGDRVIFGATVTVEDQETEETSRFQIVGEDEADTKANKISYTSPIAKALIGKEEDEEVIVKTPRGKKEYIIMKVEYTA